MLVYIIFLNGITMIEKNTYQTEMANSIFALITCISSDLEKNRLQLSLQTTLNPRRYSLRYDLSNVREDLEELKIFRSSTTV